MFSRAQIRPSACNYAQSGALYPIAAARRRFKPPTETVRNTVGTHNCRISAQTIRRRLDATRHFAKRPYKEAILIGRYRLAWVNNHREWGQATLAAGLLTDESKFNMSLADGNKRIYRRGVRGLHTAVPWNTTDGVMVESRGRRQHCP